MVGHWPILRILSGLGKTILVREDRLFSFSPVHTLAKFGQRGKFPKLAKKLLGKQTIQAKEVYCRGQFSRATERLP